MCWVWLFVRWQKLKGAIPCMNKNLGLSGQAKSTQRLPRTPCCRTSTTPPLTRAPSTPTPSLKYTHAKSHVQLRHHWNLTLYSTYTPINPTPGVKKTRTPPVRDAQAWRMPCWCKYLVRILSQAMLSQLFIFSYLLMLSSTTFGNHTSTRHIRMFGGWGTMVILKDLYLKLYLYTFVFTFWVWKELLER